MKIRYKKWFPLIDRILLIAVFVASSGVMVSLCLSDGDMTDFRKKLKISENKTQISNPVKWKKLQKLNPDIYAWIEIPGTNIDYPVACSAEGEKENFYLNHGADGKHDLVGTIFTQKMNAKDFSDPVTVLYGHKMLNGSMFGRLKQYAYPKFMKKNDEVYVYTPEKIFVYRVLASGEVDDFNITKKYDFSDGLEKDFVQMVEELDVTRAKMQLKKRDKVLVLSTCSIIDTKRRIVVAKQIKTL